MIEMRQLSLDEFEQAVSLLSEPEKTEVFDQFALCEQKLKEGQIIHSATIKYLIHILNTRKENGTV